MFNEKKIDGIKVSGYILIALILIGIGFLSAILVQHSTRIAQTGSLSNKEAATSPENTSSAGKYNDKVSEESGEHRVEVALESPDSKTPAQSITSTPARDYPTAGIIDADISRDSSTTTKGFVTAHIIAGKKPVRKVVEKKQKINAAGISSAQKNKFPSITSATWEKSENTNVYVIHGNKRIDPYSGRVLETIDSASSSSNFPSQSKAASATPPEQKVINNYYSSDNKETGEQEKTQTDENRQAAADDKEFWYGGYSAISTNPQTTIGEAYRERLKNWPNNNDMNYCGPDNYYGGYSSSSGYTNIGNIYIPTGSGGYGRSYGVSGYVKIGNIYLPVSSTYYRR